MNLDLEDKVAVITGGYSGIGLAVAQSLAREKAHVVLCGRNEAQAAAEANRIKDEYGVKALGLKVDVTEPAAISWLALAVEEEFGGADILFNNAGEGTRETIMDAPDSRWQHYSEFSPVNASVNSVSPWFFCSVTVH